MKVLKDNYNGVKHTIDEIKNKYPIKLVCEKCKSEMMYDESDIEIGEYGCATIICPCCGHANYLDDGEHDVDLNADNVEFPKHFHHTCVETGAVDCFNNEEIKKCICKAIEFFREYKNAHDWFTEYGNLYIHVNRWEGDENYWVVVSNNHYDTYIQFEEQDY